MPKQFDYLVIGGGSGGLATAKRAAEYGAKVALVEHQRLGGTCVNLGCVPKKVMWYAASLAQSQQKAADYGFAAGDNSVDWPTLVAKRETYIRRLNGIYEDGLRKLNISLFSGYARFTSSNVVEVNGETLSAPHLTIATGTQPLIPPIPGAQWGISSDGFFALTQRPRRVAIIGAGYIAVELACTLQALGTEVTLVTRHGQVLREFEPWLGEALLAHMAAAGITCISPSTIIALNRDSAGQLNLQTKEGATPSGFDSVIWAVGRRPNHADINLPVTGLITDDHGFISTDEYQNTSVKGLYALGDVTGRAPLTPVAIAAGRRLADRLFGGKPDRHLDYAQIPTVIFTHPPLATLGLTEAQARNQYGEQNVKVYRSNFVAMYHALSTDRPKTHIALITAGTDERIVGLHMLGEGVDEILQGFAVAIRMGATKQDFDDTLAIHPTTAEEIVTLR